MEPYLPYIFVSLGSLMSVLIPYLFFRDEGEPFDWSHLLSKLGGWLIALTQLIITDPTIANLDWRAALILGLNLVAGFAFSEGSRLIQRGVIKVRTT